MGEPVFRNDTILGQVEDWSSTLHTFAAFISTLPHPAAIFWGKELVILQNEEWEQTAKSKDQQGKAQREHLGDKALNAIDDALRGHVQRNTPPAMFINGQKDLDNHFNLLLSPITDKGSTETPGVIAQLLPAQNSSISRSKMSEDIASMVASSENGEESISDGSDGTSRYQDPFFQHIAHMLPAGIAILNSGAEAVFVNQHFYNLTSSQHQPSDFKGWPNSLHPEDYDRVIEAYHNAFKSGEELRCEFRVLGHDEPWRLLLITSLGDDGLRKQSLKEFGGFICVLVDITPNKAQELAQKKATREAHERKEQQERFIDMISHEIRNPLSAVLHCAEDISEACEADSAHPSDDQKVLVSTAVVNEAVETIKLCVHHQKNIVDDILSFSKLDSSMMSLVPKSVQPRTQLTYGLKMFQPELRKQDIVFEYAIDVSYDEYHVDWVKADLMRINQVVVNLMTNAIKFTEKKKGVKKISVGVGISLERPTSYPPNVVFFDTDNASFRLDGTNTSEWGNGETLYILVAITDTGIGINPENQGILFQRFRQATPKTENEYGGSGLGLNIARKICQLHGGEIGVASKEGEGSTFGFFFKVRRTEAGEGEAPPKDDQLDRGEVEDLLHLKQEQGAPVEHVDDEDALQDLVEPPTKQLEHASAEKKTDDKYDNTADIADKIKEAPSDEYAISDRPPRPASFQPEDERSKLVKLQGLTDSQRVTTLVEGKKRTQDDNSDKVKVLLVEDNAINQRVLKRRLENKGLSIITANNGREAVDAIHKIVGKRTSQEKSSNESGYDVILMDQEMPIMDGNAATKAIRKMESEGLIGHIPILGVTANARDEQKDEMQKAGMDDVISKPYRIEDIIEMISGLVKRFGGS